MIAGQNRLPPGSPKRTGLALLGLIAGFCSGFLGIGGGLVLVPGLAIAFHYPIKRAVGTALATIALVSLAGVLAELIVQGSNIYWALGLVLTVGSLIGSWAGGRILARLSETPLRFVFALFLLVASYRMLMAAQVGDGTGPLTLGEEPAVGYLLAFPVGALAGLASVLFGIGGGGVMVPALSFLFSDLPFHAARATSLLTIVPTSALGTYQHRGMGTVDLPVALRLIPAGLAGVVLGVVSVNLLPAGPGRLAFAAFLALSGIRLLTLKRSRAGSRASALLEKAGGAGRSAHVEASR